MQSAIRFDLDALRAEGRRVPAPKSFSTYVEISAQTAAPWRPLLGRSATSPESSPPTGTRA